MTAIVNNKTNNKTMVKLNEFRKRLRMDSRVGKVKCTVCGKELEVPNMYSEKERKAVLKPYCPTAVILHVQWLIYHGWHVSTLEANPAGVFYCPDCFPVGTPEYSRSEACDAWCKQSQAWMKENNGKR